MSRHRRGCKERGVSLLEVTLAVLVLTVASLGLLHSLALSFQVLERARTLRIETLRYWNESQAWRAELDTDPLDDDSPFEVRSRRWEATEAGVPEMEAVHGPR